MNWQEEVQQAVNEVWREFSDPRLNGVRVEAAEHFDEMPQWGSATQQTRRSPWVIRVYRPAFDQMPDPENRAKQLRDVLRHEFLHTLGHPGHVSDRQPNSNWYGTEPFVIEGPNGLIVRLPGLDR